MPFADNRLTISDVKNLTGKGPIYLAEWAGLRFRAATPVRQQLARKEDPSDGK